MKRNILYLLLCVAIHSIGCGVSKKVIVYEDVCFDESQQSIIIDASNDTPMRVLLITSKEDSILLRMPSMDINFESKDTLLAYFIERLYKTVISPANSGVGIAAPQVGILKNIIWVQRFDKKDNPFEVYINPKITKYTEKKQFCLEGCLSIPARRDTTKDRAYAIMMEYDRMDGSHHVEMIEAFTAVIFQHEIDHLNGILYLDHLDIEIKEAEERMKR